MQPQQTWTNSNLTGTYVLLSSNNGLFRFWAEENPPGLQEVLTFDLSSWTSMGPVPLDDPMA